MAVEPGCVGYLGALHVRLQRRKVGQERVIKGMNMQGHALVALACTCERADAEAGWVWGGWTGRVVDEGVPWRPHARGPTPGGRGGCRWRVVSDGS